MVLKSFHGFSKHLPLFQVTLLSMDDFFKPDSYLINFHDYLYNYKTTPKNIHLLQQIIILKSNFH